MQLFCGDGEGSAGMPGSGGESQHAVTRDRTKRAVVNEDC